MDKSQGRVLAGAVPGRRGRGGTLYYVVKCPGDTLLRGVVYFVTDQTTRMRSCADQYGPTPHGYGKILLQNKCVIIMLLYQ